MEKSDAQIRDEVLLELGWDFRLHATELGVGVEDGVVVLSGTVGSVAERLAAAEAAHRAIGVLDVANELVVRTARASSGGDAAVAGAVRRALRARAGLAADRVRSTVSSGWVTLDGGLASARQRAAAELAVRSAPGVRGVRNRIAVAPAGGSMLCGRAADDRPTGERAPPSDRADRSRAGTEEETSMAEKSDARLQREVLRELERDERVEHAGVGVGVHGGAVALMGRVGSHAERIVARQAARRVPGVLDLVDALIVKLPRVFDPDDIDLALAARGALRDAGVPDERVRLTVSAGLVTLEGDLDAEAERDAVERAIELLPGVRGVADEVEILGPSDVAEAARAAVEAALERRADRAVDRLQVCVEDGRLTLAGPVRSAAEKDAILAAARRAPGVRSVHSLLTIDPDAADRPPDRPGLG